MQSSQMGVVGRVAPRESEANAHARGLFLTVCGVLLMTPDALFIRLIDADTWSLLVWRSFLISAALTVFMLAFHGSHSLRLFAQLGLDV